ncbi:MAG: hypothetical protein A2491_10805, partial [Bacteroidetes bacterium RIFOXYC12_FULL_35_7]
MDKGRLTLQWHINEVCNQHCEHCYQSEFAHPGFEFEKLVEIIHAYKKLVTDFNEKYNNRFYKGHINITGGEPLLHPDFFRLLEFLSAYKKHFTFAILSNGSLITDEVAVRLKIAAPEFIQLSIDGNEKMHDRIRSKNNFKTVVNAIKILNKHKIKTYISFTAHSENYKCFPDVAKTGRKYNVAKVWADRFVPFNTASESLKTLNIDESNDFFRIMNYEKKKKNLFSKTKIEMSRALMFFETGEKPYHCAAGDTLICILHDGILFPCRRLPISCGNIFEENLSELYFHNSFLK